MTIPGSFFSNSPGISNETPSTTPDNAMGIAGEYGGTPLYLFPGQFTVTIYLNLQNPDNVTNMSSMLLEVNSGNHTPMSIVGNFSISRGNPDTGIAMFTFSFSNIAGNVWYSMYGPAKNSGIMVSKMVVAQTAAFQN